MYLVAEIGINHNGELELAKQLITAAADADFDALRAGQEALGEQVAALRRLNETAGERGAASGRTMMLVLSFSRLTRAAAEDKSSKKEKTPHRGNRIAVSTYSFWHFRGKPEGKTSVEGSIDQAAKMGFDGVEILHRQMSGESNDYLQALKRRAIENGVGLTGFSIHQGFGSPDKNKRQKNIMII